MTRRTAKKRKSILPGILMLHEEGYLNVLRFRQCIAHAYGVYFAQIAQAKIETMRCLAVALKTYDNCVVGCIADVLSGYDVVKVCVKGCRDTFNKIDKRRCASGQLTRIIRAVNNCNEHISNCVQAYEDSDEPPIFKIN